MTRTAAPKMIGGIGSDGLGFAAPRIVVGKSPLKGSSYDETIIPISVDSVHVRPCLRQ